MTAAKAREILLAIPGLADHMPPKELAKVAWEMAERDHWILVGQVLGVVRGVGAVCPVGAVLRLLCDADPGEVRHVIQGLLAVGDLLGMPPSEAAPGAPTVKDSRGREVGFLMFERESTRPAGRG